TMPASTFEKKNQLYTWVISAANLVVGSIREHLGVVSSRGPHGAFIIPIVAIDNSDFEVEIATEISEKFGFPERGDLSVLLPKTNLAVNPEPARSPAAAKRKSASKKK